MAERLRLGLVGAGVAGQLRARATQDVPGAVLIGVADPDRAAAARAARAHAARTVADYRELVSAPDVDAVIVSTPTPLHEAVAVAALRAGKHVLCEKPLAPTSQACRRILEVAHHTGRTVAVGFNHRYLPPFRYLKQVLDAGGLGKLAHVRALAGHAGLGEFRADWMYVGALSGGGAMMDLGVHMTDLVRFLVGEIAEVHGAVTAAVWGVEGSEDDALALMRTVEGTPIAYHATWTEWRGYVFRVEAFGERGMVRAQYGPMLNEIVWRRPGGGRSRRFRLYPGANLRDRVLGWRDTARRTFADELRDFGRRVHGERSALGDGEDGLRAVALAEAVYDSSRRGAGARPEGQA